jgi:uncharacterized protein YqgC (DUF456 family)
MDYFLIVVAGLFLIGGLIGCLISKLPGTPLCYLGIMILNFSSIAEYSVHFFIRWGLIIIAIQGLNYFIPHWGKRKFGGSRRGVWGSLIGMLAGIYFGPWGIVTGAILGALIGELIAGKESNRAIHEAISSFSFFILGTISQLIVAGILIDHYLFNLLTII